MIFHFLLIMQTKQPNRRMHKNAAEMHSAGSGLRSGVFGARTNGKRSGNGCAFEARSEATTQKSRPFGRICILASAEWQVSSIKIPFSYYSGKLSVFPFFYILQFFRRKMVSCVEILSSRIGAVSGTQSVAAGHGSYFEIERTMAEGSSVNNEVREKIE